MSNEHESITELIARGEALEREDEAAAIAYFAELAGRFPENASVLFAYAGAFDYAGREADAVAPYRLARELGLTEDELKRWYVQFGSTLRNVGEYAESVAVLTEGRVRFPDDVAIACFLALAHYSAGESALALRIALEAILAESAAGRVDLRRYNRALDWYAKDLTGDAVE
jgi:tetratricopeptide (TPR) repeat protein